VWGIGPPSVDDVYDSRAIGWVSLVYIAPSVGYGEAKERVRFMFALREVGLRAIGWVSVA